ncbi:MAG: globin domain-containing protein [Rhodomicrobiaceae bacterium]
MTPAQLRVLQRSFAKIEPIADQFGTVFYNRLFTIAPEIKPMFRTDLKAQQAKFMKVITEVVQLHLRSVVSLPVTAQASASAVLPGAFWSGKLHAAYGVRMEDYATMKSALVWALEKTLGAECTDEVKDAWSTAYDIVVGAMEPGMTSPEDDENEPVDAMQSRLDATERGADISSLFKSVGKR